ncbi:ABC transporter permease [Eubacteriales bacterium OttesenSCG-928-A19]|nr:ABC transporter permease [Eubacteriales bacterium OttesenSCG-928-A19]
MKSKRTWLCLPLYVWAVVLVGLPLLYIVGVSFFARGASWGVSDELTLANYRNLLSPTALRAFGESIVTAALTSGVALLVGYPFAYAMAKATPRRRTMLMVLVIVPFWTSALIRTYGWMILLRANGPINTALLSLGLIERPLKLLYTRGAVILGLIYTLLPFAILPCYTRIEQMDWHTVEAARDLGATPARAFLTITLPLTRSGIISALTLTFVPCMGIFFISDLLGGGKVTLIGNLIQDQLLKGRNMPFGAALSVVMLLLTGLVLYLQRRAGGETTLF